jgi:hypothetical protein
MIGKLREAIFTTDVFDGQRFPGFTDGETWNGWARPYFTFEQAQAVLNAHKDHSWKAWYDETQDSFVFDFSHDGNDELDEFPAVEIAGMKLYPIGAGCWIWEEETVTA